MLIVGLTGGIGTGKSTVSSQLKDKYKLRVIDADLIAKQVVFPGKSAYKKVVAEFGSEIPNLVNDDKSLNRDVLGRYVFGNKQRLSRLNRIVHPAVKWEIGYQIIWTYVHLYKLVILDVPLLFESGLDLICGKIITVTCDREIQVQRLLQRNPELLVHDIEKRIDSQMDNIKRCSMADLVIDNNSSLTNLETQLQSIVREIEPNLFITIVDCFPPFGILSGILTISVRYFIHRFRENKIR